MRQPGKTRGYTLELGRGSLMAVVAALVLAFAGCSSGNAEQKARNDQEAVAVQSELAEVPGVVKVEVRYAQEFTISGSGSANLIVKHGTDLEQVADQAVGAIWRSRLDPLRTIRVSVLVDEDRTVGFVRDYVLIREHSQDKTAELEAKYGPRPVKTR